MPDDELDNRREWVWDLEDAFRANIASILATIASLLAAIPIAMAARSTADGLIEMWLYHPDIYARFLATAAAGLYFIGLAAGYTIASSTSSS